VADDQSFRAGRGPAVIARYDFAIGAADAERQRAHEDRTIRTRRLGDILHAR